MTTEAIGPGVGGTKPKSRRVSFSRTQQVPDFKKQIGRPFFLCIFFKGCILVVRLIFPLPPFRIIFFPKSSTLKTGIFHRFLKPAQTSKKFAAAGGSGGIAPPLQRKVWILVVKWNVLVP